MTRFIHGMPGVYNSSLPTLSSGDGSGLAVDSSGRLIIGNIVASVAIAPALTAVTTNAASVSTSFGTVTKANAKNAAGNVFSVYATNTNSTVRFLQLHNKATAPAGSDSAVAVFEIPGGTANAPGSILIGTDFFTEVGQYFSTGIGWAISTVKATFTDSATATEHTVDVRYI